MPVSGVRISCAMPASVASTASIRALPKPFPRARADGARTRLAGLLRFRLAIVPFPGPTMAWKDGSIETGQTADFGRRCTLRAQFAQAGRLRGLRKFAAVGTKQEFVVMVPGLRQAKERLQKAMHRGRIKEIAPADDVGNALGGIVERHGQVITG